MIRDCIERAAEGWGEDTEDLRRELKKLFEKYDDALEGDSDNE